MRKLYYLPLFMIVLAISACDRKGPVSEEEEERDPLVKTGQEYMDQKLWDEAELSFKEALDKDPRMARPHLDLALIYQQYKPNYIHAIYHYDRYLELRPDSEKADLILEQKAKIERELVRTIIQGSPDVKNLLADRKRLMQENDSLKKQLTALQEKPTQQTAATQSTVTQTVPKTTTSAATQSTTSTKPATDTSKYQIYHVVGGDTLTKIATTYYGDPARWDVIYDANRETLATPNSLKVGQTLVIPKLEK